MYQKDKSIIASNIVCLNPSFFNFKRIISFTAYLLYLPFSLITHFNQRVYCQLKLQKSKVSPNSRHQNINFSILIYKANPKILSPLTLNNILPHLFFSNCILNLVYFLRVSKNLFTLWLFFLFLVLNSILSLFWHNYLYLLQVDNLINFSDNILFLNIH